MPPTDEPENLKWFRQRAYRYIQNRVIDHMTESKDWDDTTIAKVREHAMFELLAAMYAAGVEHAERRLVRVLAHGDN